MQSSEYEDILASVQKLVRQAYDLGRAEALKQVVEVLKAGPTPSKPLALAAPVPGAEPEHRHEAVHQASMPAAPHNGAKTEPDASFDVLATPAKAPDAPPRDEKAPSRPWWSR